MTLEELRKEHDEEYDEEEDEEDESEDAKKSFDEALLETISTLTDHVKALSENQAFLEDALIKAMEEKPETQLDLQPSTSDSEDIGDEVVVPDVYQANSVQAGLDDDKSGDDKPEGDQKGLSMQEKAQKVNFDFTTETPRPSAAIESINKSDMSDFNLILKDARDGGYEGLSLVAKKIQRGDYYTPSEEERLF